MQDHVILELHAMPTGHAGAISEIARAEKINTFTEKEITDVCTSSN
jgi:hypothetical protein